MYICVCIYIYIYIYVYRERDRLHYIVMMLGLDSAYHTIRCMHDYRTAAGGKSEDAMSGRALLARVASTISTDLYGLSNTRSS